MACTSSATTTLDTPGVTGQYSAITIGVDGLALISYQDASNTDLKIVHCANAFCVDYLRRR